MNFRICQVIAASKDGVIRPSSSQRKKKGNTFLYFLMTMISEKCKNKYYCKIKRKS